MRDRHILLFLSLLGALTVSLVAQTTTTLRIDVRLVNLVATVTDSSNKYIMDLTADDFVVEEDGVVQKISHFTQDHDIPVSVGVLLDTSGSMDRKIRTAASAVNRFINNVHPDDDIFLMTFSRNAEVVQDFTSDRRKLSRALDDIRLGGGTVLYDALQSALEKVRMGRHDKRAILVISDGMDAGSRRTNLERVIRTIRSSEVLIYGLGTAEVTYADPAEHVPFTLPSPQGGPRIIRPPAGPTRPAAGRGTSLTRGVNMRTLSQFAENSGGRAFLLSETFINDGNVEIDKVLTLIADELRSQYTIGYYPSVPDDGRVHSIRVTTRGNHVVRTRSFLAR
jgi:VWFA-related protein